MPGTRTTPLRARVRTEEYGSPNEEALKFKADSLGRCVEKFDTSKDLTSGKPGGEELPDFDEFRHEMELRRRRRSRVTFLIFSMMVLVPTLLAAVYLLFFATSRFTVETAFVVRMPEGGVQASVMPGLGGAGGSTTQDAIAIQEWLQSRNAMNLIEGKFGILSHFSGPDVDALQRLPTNATAERLFRRYKSRVRTGFDPTEGILRISVTTHDPQLSLEVSGTLLDAAQNQITEITETLTSESVRFAAAQVSLAEKRMETATAALKEAQIRNAVLSHEDESRLLAEDLSSLNARLIDARIVLRGLQGNRVPNAARLRDVEIEVETLENEIEVRRNRISGTNNAGKATAATKIEVAALEANLAIQRELLLETLRMKERVVVEANRQIRKLIVMVKPTPSDEPSYPKPSRDIPIVFLVFLALHMLSMISLPMIRDHFLR